MRKVTDKPCTDISFSNANENKFYGVVHFRGKKGFICRDCLGGSFSVHCLDDAFTRGNNWGCNRSIDLVDTIRILLKSAFTVYEFDTVQELMKWCSE